MGLFGHKKKKEVSKIPDLPRFDDFDVAGANAGFVEDNKGLKMPSYESAFDKDTERHEEGPIMGPSPFDKKPFDAPVRDPNIGKPKETYEERIDPSYLDNVIPKIQKPELTSPFKKEPVETMQPKFESVQKTEEKTMQQEPKMILKKQMKVPQRVVDERPVFVQIDDYKDAMNDIEILKQKIREIEYILDRMNEIKSEEQLEISNCETSLNKIKEKLIGIDKKLFEI